MDHTLPSCCSIVIDLWPHKHMHWGREVKVLREEEFAAELIKGVPWIDPSTVIVSKVEAPISASYPSITRQTGVVEFPHGRYETWSESHDYQSSSTSTVDIQLGELRGYAVVPVSGSISSYLEREAHLRVQQAGEYALSAMELLAELLSPFGFHIGQQHFWITPSYDLTQLARLHRESPSSLSAFSQHSLEFTITHEGSSQYRCSGSTSGEKPKRLLVVSVTKEAEGSWVTISSGGKFERKELFCVWPVPLKPVVDFIEGYPQGAFDLVQAVERARGCERPIYSDMAPVRSWWRRLLQL